MQGDITGAIDAVTGKLVAAYTYDAYGNMSAQPISDDNLSVIGSALMMILLPQSYRGYTFSFIGEELCYYLGSRFYSPRLGRFLNADKHFDTGTGVLGTNVYTYCNNNPVMFTDPTGEAANNGLSEFLAALLIPIILDSFIKYLNSNMEIAPNSKIKIDKNYLITAYARYKKSKYLYSRLKIVFGDYFSWKNSTSAYNKNTQIYYDYYTNYVMTQTENPNGDILSGILINNIALRPTIIIANITASAAKKVFNKIWGSNGIDSNNSKNLIVFKVTQDSKYNGVYYYSPSKECFYKVG